MKDETLKVLSWVLIIWTSLGIISTFSSVTDTFFFEFLFEVLIIWQSVRVLKQLK